MAPGDDDDGREKNALGALVREAVGLRKAARWKDAAERFDEVQARLDRDSDSDRDVRLGMMYLKVASLHEHGDAQGTLAASDALLAAYGSRTDQRAIGFLADTLWLKARALGLASSATRSGDICSKSRSRPWCPADWTSM